VTTLDASLLRQAAASAAGTQHFPTGALYVVATPIGNLADLSLRAIHVLGLVDAIACEDTRHTAPLLRQLGIADKPLLAVHEHNEHEAAAAVLARLARAERVAYVSDAGTPAISDPGAALVAAARTAGWRCVPVPGASSATTALSVAGDTGANGFVFIGFLPAKGAERSRAVAALAASHAAQVLFEAPHRIEALATALGTACGERLVTVCRELTKQFETVVTLPAIDFSAWLAGDPNRARGEFVLVVHALPAPDAGAAELAAHDPMLRTLLAALPLKQAVAVAAELSGAARNRLYERALELKREDGDDSYNGPAAPLRKDAP
jgi:16S rRNA (cytidine1402-2'-O)-methyltransferase